MRKHNENERNALELTLRLSSLIFAVPVGLAGFALYRSMTVPTETYSTPSVWFGVISGILFIIVANWVISLMAKRGTYVMNRKGSEPEHPAT